MGRNNIASQRTQVGYLHGRLDDNNKTSTKLTGSEGNTEGEELEGAEEQDCSLRHKIMPATKGEGGEHGSGKRQEQFVSPPCFDREE